MKKLIKLASVVIVLGMMAIPTHALWLNGTYRFNEIGTDYNLLYTTANIPGKGYTLAARASLTSGQMVRVNIKEEGATSVGSKDFPIYDNTVPSLIINAGKGKKYSFYVRSTSGKASGAGHFRANK